MAGRRAQVDLRLGIALVITVLFHGGLLIVGSFRSTYDAYVHLFFGDHYARSWFSSWEPRWYTGFTTVSYPPGSHQLLALWSKVLDDGTAFIPVMLGAILLTVIGIFRYAKLWVSERAAGYAAILAAVSSSISETAHVFGQLPTLLSLGMLLNATPFVYRWVRWGGGGALAAAVVCSAGTTAAHHVTTLFGSVFIVGPVLALALVEVFRTPLVDEPNGRPSALSRATWWPVFARRLRRVLPALVRTSVYGFLVLISLISVVLPYWLWSASDPITQIPIPHASRDNFLVNTNAGLVFWAVPWGVMLFALPYALVRGAVSKAWPLAASLALLTLLGTGGTTPIPRMMLGGAFEILTLDRFTFWATILVLPFAGRLVESLVHGRLGDVLRRNVGRRVTVGLLTAGALAVLAMALFASSLTSYRPFQPDPIDMDPIVTFIEKDQHDRWRYLTLGFGDQMAWLSAQTTAETVDGNYHSARRLPELTTTPVERLEGAKYSGVPGLGSLQQFLATPEKYHLKYVFSNDQFYDPLLWASGWQRLEPLENGIAVWQHDDVEPLAAGRLRLELPMWQRLLWGVLPMTAMVSAWCFLIANFLGVDIGRRRYPLPGFVTRSYAAIDRRLLAASQRIGDGDQREDWNRLARLRAAAAGRVARPVGARRRVVQASVVVVTALVLAGAAAYVLVDPVEDTPAETVYSYYDALDLRQTDGAYALLDPASRPTYTQYLTERSVVNGLVASYARLQSMTSTQVDRDDDTVVVESELVYVTSLSEHVVTSVDVLHLTDDGWRLEYQPPDPTIPPDQFVRRAGVDYLSQGRRQVGDQPTAYQDVLDRPEISILSASLVRVDEQLSVVGEVRNDDVDPGYVTVTAELLDTAGEELTDYAAATGAVHTALPGEIVPFRIDFEGVAGLVEVDGELVAEQVEFEAGATTALALEVERIAEVIVSAKAVVTDTDLGRQLTAHDLTIVDDVLAGQLRNDGATEATVPHVFVTLRDDDGIVRWVADHYVSEAVRPQRSGPFEMPLPTPDDIETIEVPITTYANSLRVGRVFDDRALFRTGTDWPSLDVMVIDFTRSAS